jgi:hypothetical protein
MPIPRHGGSHAPTPVTSARQAPEIRVWSSSRRTSPLVFDRSRAGEELCHSDLSSQVLPEPALPKSYPFGSLQRPRIDDTGARWRFGSTLVGIDHGFSFPVRFFEEHGLLPDWPSFLDDFPSPLASRRGSQRDVDCTCVYAVPLCAV